MPLHELTPNDKTFGELLVRQRLLTPEQWQLALTERGRSKEPLSKIVVRMGWVKESDMLRTLQGLLVVTFHLGPEEYAFEANYVLEVIRFQQPNPLPKMPPYILGLFNHRGHILPVIDLALRLHHPAIAIHDETRIIIIQQDTKVFGLVVDSVEAVMRLPLDTLDQSASLLQRIEPNLVHGVVRWGDRVITLINIQTLGAEMPPTGNLPSPGEKRK
jgi:purine-binding chemotaxis protein CheW